MNIKKFNQFYKPYLIKAIELNFHGKEDFSFQDDFLDCLKTNQKKLISLIGDKLTQEACDFFSHHPQEIAQHLECLKDDKKLIDDVFKFEDLYLVNKNLIGNFQLVHDLNLLPTFDFSHFKNLCDANNFSGLIPFLKKSNIQSIDIIHHCFGIKDFNWMNFDVSFLEDYQKNKIEILSLLIKYKVHGSMMNELKKLTKEDLLEIERRDKEHGYDLYNEYHRLLNLKDEAVVKLILDKFNASPLLSKWNSPQIDVHDFPELILNYIKDKNLMRDSLPFSLQSWFTPLDTLKKFNHVDAKLFEPSYFDENEMEIMLSLKEVNTFDPSLMKIMNPEILNKILSDEILFDKILSSFSHFISTPDLFIDKYDQYLNKRLNKLNEMAEKTNTIEQLNELIFFKLNPHSVFLSTGHTHRSLEQAFINKNSIESPYIPIFEDFKIHKLTNFFLSEEKQRIDFLDKYKNKYDEKLLKEFLSIPHFLLKNLMNQSLNDGEIARLFFIKKINDFEKNKIKSCLQSFKKMSNKSLSVKDKEKLHMIFYQLEDEYNHSFIEEYSLSSFRSSVIYAEELKKYRGSYKSLPVDNYNQEIKINKILLNIEDHNNYPLIDKMKRLKHWNLQQKNHFHHLIYYFVDSEFIKYQLNDIPIFRRDSNSIGHYFKLENFSFEEIKKFKSKDFDSVIHHLNLFHIEEIDFLKNATYKKEFQNVLKILMQKKDADSHIYQISLLKNIFSENLLDHEIIKNISFDFIKSKTKDFQNFYQNPEIISEKNRRIVEMTLEASNYIPKINLMLCEIIPDFKEKNNLLFEEFLIKNSLHLPEYQNQSITQSSLTALTILNTDNKRKLLDKLLIENFNIFTEVMTHIPDDFLQYIQSLSEEKIIYLFQKNSEKIYSVVKELIKNQITLPISSKEKSREIYDHLQKIPEDKIASEEKYKISFVGSASYPQFFNLMNKDCFINNLESIITKYPYQLCNDMRYKNSIYAQTETLSIDHQKLLLESLVELSKNSPPDWEINEIKAIDFSFIKNYWKHTYDVHHVKESKKLIEEVFIDDNIYFLYMYQFKLALDFNPLKILPIDENRLRQTFYLSEYDDISMNIKKDFIFNDVVNKEKYISGVLDLLDLEKYPYPSRLFDPIFYDFFHSINFQSEKNYSIFHEQKPLILKSLLQKNPDILFSEYSFLKHEKINDIIEMTLESSQINIQDIYKNLNSSYQYEKIEDYKNFLTLLIRKSVEKNDFKCLQFIYHDFKDDFLNHDCIFSSMEKHEKKYFMNQIKNILDNENINKTIISNDNAVEEKKSIKRKKI